MYRYVKKADLKQYRPICSDLLNQLKQKLRNKNEIEVRFYLVGSGAKNLVVQNENEPFDLDYNIEILNYNIEQLKRKITPEELKNLMMQFLNEKFKSKNMNFKNCQDSTSVITVRVVTKGEREFSFDIGILAKNSNGVFCRLTHHKSSDNTYNWLEVPNPSEIESKTVSLKKSRKWNYVRESYLQKKNMYLAKNDTDHPSFVVFAESVNETYAKFFADKQKK